MFGAWPQLSTPPEDLIEKERSPPPLPTKPEFPFYNHQPSFHSLTSHSLRELSDLVGSIKRPHDVTPEYLQALNLAVTPDASFRDLLFSSEAPCPDGSTSSPESNRLRQVVEELQLSESEAFREITRLPPLPGRPRIRLTHTRKFWTGLEKMAQYWDCSLDQLYSVSDTEHVGKRPILPATLDVTHQPQGRQPGDISTAPADTKQVYKGRRISTGSAMPLMHLNQTVSGLVETVAWAFNCQVRVPVLPPRLSIQNVFLPVRQNFIVGRLPREKEAARQGVLEGPVMGICCRAWDTLNGKDMPAGKADAKPDAEAKKETNKAQEWKGIIDLARELAVLLLLAQERAHEIDKEIKPGEGKWWTSVPRWGGGLGGAMEHELLSQEPICDITKPDTPHESFIIPSAATPEHPARTISTNTTKTNSPCRQPKRKADGEFASLNPSPRSSEDKSPPTPPLITKPTKNIQAAAERWKTVRPGSSTWDRRMRYLRIGAPPAAPTDHVIAVTALNHHVALLSMPVSSTYLAWLSRGESPDHQHQHHGPAAGTEAGSKPKVDPTPLSSSTSCCCLHLRRTRWFNLLDAADRVEFVRGLWMVMEWLMR